MTPDRWQKLEQLFRAALELEGDERAAYLRQVCAGDDAMRRDLQSLLTWDDRPVQIFGERALQTLANVLSPNRLIGQQLGKYKITSLIGSGGMGDVYKAADNLGREVAIKVLPPSLLDEPVRLERFEREARMLAALGHPNIAVIHGFEHVGDTHFLVMELVQGFTLADRIAAEGALPIKDVLDIGHQLAEALEAAHEKRIIHRDLKPANVNITPEGVVKVLDFGLAKRADEETGHARTVTLTSGAATTHEGAILGTPAYMSPEQALGKVVDKRSDIWSFGCVLYELLTAKLPFCGDTPQDTIAVLLEREPDWGALPPTTPDRLRELLQRCLRKNPRERTRDIGDARIEIEQLQRDAARPGGLHVIGVRDTRSRSRLEWVLGALVVVAGAFAVYQSTRPVVAPAQIIRSEILPPEGLSFGSIALSPDGRQLAFVAAKNGKKQLWVRVLATSSQRALPGTESASYPFWSADSLHIGFFADGKLKKIPAAGGATQILADAPNGRGGTWNANDVIVFAPNSTTPLHVVPAAGGVSSKPLTHLDSESREISQRWPCFLPGGKRLLYFSESALPGFTGSGVNGTVFVGSLDGTTKTRLIAGAYGARYVSQGYIVFARGNELVAQRFRPETLSLDTQAVTLSDDLEIGAGVDGPPLSVSDSGDVLVFRRRGQPGSQQRLLQWFGRDGAPQGTLGKPERLWSLRLSPNGQFVAAEVEDPETRSSNIWLYDTASSTPTRFTFGQVYTAPVWSPDGRSIVVSRRAPDRHFSLFRKPTNRSSAEELLVQAPGNLYADDWSHDERFFLYTFIESAEKPGGSIWVLPMQEPRTPHRLFQSAADDRYPHFSPNDRWVAYRSNETGHNEIYVTSFIEGSGKWPISSGGGDLPVWRSDGQELYFLSPDGELMAASVHSDGPVFTYDPPKALFSMNVLGGYGERYAASADGSRFLALVNREEAPRPLNAVFHWSAPSK